MDLESDRPATGGCLAGKNQRVRARSAATRLAGEADGKADKSPGPALVESWDYAAMSRQH